MMSQQDTAIPPPERRRHRRLERPGLPPRHERTFKLVSTLLVIAYAIGWIIAIVTARTPAASAQMVSRTIAANPLSPQTPPPATYLLDAALRRFSSGYRGYSGRVYVQVLQPGDTAPLPNSLPAGVRIEYRAAAGSGPARAEPARPGVWRTMLRIGDAVREVPDLALIRLVPLSEKREGRIGAYRIGTWPFERGGRPRTPAYAPPVGLVQVTPQNMNTRVSEHFELRDFLTKGQTDIWPKYVALSPRLLDKLELTIMELERTGHPVQNVGVISGFRTPDYNVEGGNPAGRGALSRHMYGDAMDFYIDNDNNGRMDDLNGDGRVNIEDARLLAGAANRVEQQYPSLTGGIGVYQPTSAHSGFVHIDTRGYRARW